MAGTVRVRNREQFLGFAADIRQVNSALESIGVTERIDYTFKTVPGAGGDREYRVELSHGRAEREALTTVCAAVWRIRRQGGLTAAGGRVGVLGLGQVAPLVASLASGRGALFTAADYAKVSEAESMLRTRAELDRQRVRADKERALKRRVRGSRIDALVASGMPPAEADVIVRKRMADDDKRVARRRRGEAAEAASWHASRRAAQRRAERSVIWD